jgi:hypothetical protein
MVPFWLIQNGVLNLTRGRQEWIVRQTTIYPTSATDTDHWKVKQQLIDAHAAIRFPDLCAEATEASITVEFLNQPVIGVPLVLLLVWWPALRSEKSIPI